MSHKNMDEETLKTMPDYVQKLPKKIRDFIFDGEWESRTEEIAIKYSLNENQTDILINQVLFIIIGLEKPEDFDASLETELGVSELLTEQIMKDLDARVFQYAFDFISRGSELILPLPKLSESNFGVLNNQIEEVEIPPVILPLVESDEERKKVMEQNRIANTERPDVAGALRASPTIPKISEVPANLPGVTIDTDNQIKDGAFIGSEFIQKPIVVPRFNSPSADIAGSLEPSIRDSDSQATLSARINQAEKPQNIIDAKLNSVTSASAPADKKPEVQYPPRYESDPYREPIE
jgi:hypothetical protein